MIAGAIIIGIGIAVLLVALGLNGWSFKPDFKTEEFSSAQENTALDVRLDAGKLKIEYHDEDNIQISYPVSSNYKTKITESDGKLSVEGNKHKWYTFGWKVTIPEMVIKIPRDKITGVEIKLNAGSVDLTDGAFENVKIKVNAGSCNVGNITSCKLMDIRMNAGSINVKGAACEAFSCDINAGSARFQKIDSAQSKLEVSAGSASLAFIGAIEEYTATVKVSAGSCNGLSTRTGGDRTIDVKVSAGSVNVSFGA